MKKFLFTADLHFSRYSQDKIISESGLPERLDSLIKTLNGMFNYGRENNIRDIVISGDLLHDKSIVYSLAQDCMLKLFRENQDINFTIISGNHDQSGKGSDAFSVLRTLDNEKNINRIKGDHFHDKENDILYVPYSYKMVDIIKTNSAKYLVSHFGLNEGVLSSGISVISELGLKDMVGKYKYVLLGHYHKPQDILNENINVYYVGSPIQLNFGEKNEEKRFLIIDAENETIESVPTTEYKKYIEYVVNDKNKSQINEIIKQANDDKKNGHHVQLIKKTNKVSFDGVDDINIIDKTEKDITNRGISTSMTIDMIFKNYLEINEIDNKKDIKLYMEEATSIVNSI